MMILPVALLVIPPTVLAFAEIPVAPSLLVIWIVPSLTTLWLLSIVTAVPLVRVTDPAAAILMSSGVPVFTVEVRTGAVVAVPMVVSAKAGVAMRATRQVDANRVLRMKILLKSGGMGPATISGRSRRHRTLEKIPPPRPFAIGRRQIYFVATCRNRNHRHCAAPPNLLKDMGNRLSPSRKRFVE